MYLEEDNLGDRVPSPTAVSGTRGGGVVCAETGRERSLTQAQSLRLYPGGKEIY